MPIIVRTLGLIHLRLLPNPCSCSSICDLYLLSMSNQFRLDLHTHSIISHDGGIDAEEFRKLLADESVCVAITDHNQISFAKNLKTELGERIIVGEEILSSEGEIIGLFLNELIPAGLSAMETIERIKKQGGLVYLPHPLEKTRHGLRMDTLERISGVIDIVEVFNARTREPWLSKKIAAYALEHNIAQAASSDAHGPGGFGSAYSCLSELPTRENLFELLKNARLEKHRAPFLSLFEPARNKLKKLFKL